MSRPVIIGVELVTVTDDDGRTRRVPDIGASVRKHFMRTGPNIYTASWGEHMLTVKRIARIGGTVWYYGSGSRRILKALAHLGAKIKLVADLTKAQRDAILARGFRPLRRVSDNAIVGIMPRVVIAEENPITVALDGQYVAGEEYSAG